MNLSPQIYDELSTYVESLGPVTPEDEKERAALADYEGNPVRFCREVLGIETLTEPQEKFLLAFVASAIRGRWLLRGGHGTGKTAIGAMVLLYVWTVLAIETDGVLIMYSAPKLASIEETIYAQVLDLAQIAGDRGFTVPGLASRSADRYAGASRRSVSWSTADGKWNMEALTSVRKAGGGLAHGLSGRHHKGIQIVVIEEAEGGFEGGFQAIDGLLIAGNTAALAMTNPTSVHSSIGARITKDPQLWTQIGFAVYAHPNIVMRRTVIPGSASHEAMEEALRSSAFEDRGPLETTDIEADRLDFAYALPGLRSIPSGKVGGRDRIYCNETGLPYKEREGPRGDGIPGHPDAEPHVFRPATAVIAGQYCADWLRTDDRRLLFHVNAIGARMSAGTWVEPEGHPDNVGVDCHPSRPPMACPRHGSGARAAIDTDAEAGSIILGKVVELRWEGDGDLEQAESSALHLVELYGKKATYSIDQASGGALGVYLEKLGAKVSLVAFVATPRFPPTKLYGKVLNVRTEMHVHAAAVLNAGIATAPYSATLLDEMTVLGAIIEAGESATKSAKLRRKEDIEESMDTLDVVVLALDGGKTLFYW